MGSQSGAGRCWHYVSPEYGFSVHNLLVIIRCVVSDGNKAAVHAKSKLFRPVRSAVLFAPHTDPARRCNTVGANREALGQHRRPAVNWGQVRTVWGGKDCTAGNRPECLIMIRVRVRLAGMTAAPYLELETLWSVCSAGGRQSPGKLRAAQGSRLTPQSSSLLCSTTISFIHCYRLPSCKHAPGLVETNIPSFLYSLCDHHSPHPASN